MRSSRRPLVEILYFDGCPNHEAALALVERVDRELGTNADVRLVNVPDQATAEHARFLGSPTVRVDGIDVDPHARERTEYALACRVFATEHGPAGQPDERWIRDALAKAATPTGGQAGRVLEAAAIPRSRCGTERTSRLNREQRQLYEWILQRFAQAARPPRAQLAEKARTLGLEPGDALATLAHEDLIHTDEDGDVSVAYPFSARPRGHRVTIDGGATVEAMCAIDALGIAAMLDKPVRLHVDEPLMEEQVLAAAAIPSSCCGTERTSRLTGEQRQLYEWILHRFAEAAPPTRPQLTEKARTLGLEPSGTLATLAREDLVHTDEGGDVLVAYPFSARPRGHRVTIHGGATVEAMCAIDALGIAAMLDKPVEIVSHDPITGKEISVRLNPGEEAWWNPETAVVLAGSSRCDGPSYCGCCDVLNFFETAETAEQYLRENNAVAGMPVSIPEAIGAGRAIFGDVLEAS